MLKKYLYLTLLALLCFATGLGAQQTRVRGVVTDANGEPVPGVSVLIQGTSSGVVTASDGSWQLNAAKGDVLEIACLGYLTQTVVVGDRDFIGTKLDEDVTLLDETVVVGYATMKKRDLVGAVDQVDSKVLGNRPATSVGRSLQGQIAGLNVTFTDGKPSRAVPSTSAVKPPSAPAAPR